MTADPINFPLGAVSFGGQNDALGLLPYYLDELMAWFSLSAGQCFPST